MLGMECYIILQQRKHKWADNTHEWFVFTRLFVHNGANCLIVTVTNYVRICHVAFENVYREEYGDNSSTVMSSSCQFAGHCPCIQCFPYVAPKAVFDASE